MVFEFGDQLGGNVVGVGNLGLVGLLWEVGWRGTGKGMDMVVAAGNGNMDLEVGSRDVGVVGGEESSLMR